eukprot:GHVS01063479.1.p1 GENE.GHVS01063479.1~~GHVS01063479.1.p1  ORF type:complete len:710 (-),score=41.33 GHVS01063479.1:279-2408(-)
MHFGVYCRAHLSPWVRCSTSLVRHGQATAPVQHPVGKKPMPKPQKIPKTTPEDLYHRGPTVSAAPPTVGFPNDNEDCKTMRQRRKQESSSGSKTTGPDDQAVSGCQEGVSSQRPVVGGSSTPEDLDHDDKREECNTIPQRHEAESRSGYETTGSDDQAGGVSSQRPVVGGSSTKSTPRQDRGTTARRPMFISSKLRNTRKGKYTGRPNVSAKLPTSSVPNNPKPKVMTSTPEGREESSPRVTPAEEGGSPFRSTGDPSTQCLFVPTSQDTVYPAPPVQNCSKKAQKAGREKKQMTTVSAKQLTLGVPNGHEPITEDGNSSPESRQEESDFLLNSQDFPALNANPDNPDQTAESKMTKFIKNLWVLARKRLGSEIVSPCSSRIEAIQKALTQIGSDTPTTPGITPQALLAVAAEVGRMVTRHSGCEVVGSAAEGVDLFVKGISDIDVSCKVTNRQQQQKIIQAYVGRDVIRATPSITITKCDTPKSMDRLRLDTYTCEALVDATTISLNIVLYEDSSKYFGREQVEIMKRILQNDNHAAFRPVIVVLKFVSAFLVQLFPEKNPAWRNVKKPPTYSLALLLKALFDNYFRSEQPKEEVTPTGVRLLLHVAKWISGITQRTVVRCKPLGVHPHPNASEVNCVFEVVEGGKGIQITEPLAEHLGVCNNTDTAARSVIGGPPYYSYWPANIKYLDDVFEHLQTVLTMIQDVIIE